MDTLRQRACDLEDDLKRWPAYKETMDEIEGFEMLSPILSQLCSESFRLRHWERLNEIVLLGKITSVDVTRDAKELDCDMRKELEEFKELGMRVALIRTLANRLENSLETSRGNGVDMKGFMFTFERALCEFHEDWNVEDKKQKAEQIV